MWRTVVVIVLASLCVVPLCNRNAEHVTILRVADWGGPAGDPTFLQLERSIRAEFERQHAGVRIQIENIPGAGQYTPKLLMTYVAGNPPDVITLDASSAAVFIEPGLLTDLTPLIQADPGFRLRDYFTNVLDIAVRDGRLYAIPLDFTPMVILYNKRLFDAVGVPCPSRDWTRGQFLETARALTGAEFGTEHRVQYACTFSPELPMWLPWVWAGGSDVLSPDGRHAVGYIDSPTTVETIRFLVELVRTHRVAPFLSVSAAQGRDLFRAGEAAMTLSGHWSLIEYRADGMDLGVAEVPGSGNEPATVMYAAGLAISRVSTNRQLAWEYVKYMTSADVQRKRVAGGLAISANIAVARARLGEAVEDAFLAAVPHARPPWGTRVEHYALIEDLGRTMMEDLVGGGLPVESTVSRTAERMEKELARP